METSQECSDYQLPQKHQAFSSSSILNIMTANQVSPTSPSVEDQDQEMNNLNNKKLHNPPCIPKISTPVSSTSREHNPSNSINSRNMTDTDCLPSVPNNKSCNVNNSYYDDHDDGLQFDPPPASAFNRVGSSLSASFLSAGKRKRTLLVSTNVPPPTSPKMNIAIDSSSTSHNSALEQSAVSDAALNFDATDQAERDSRVNSVEEERHTRIKLKNQEVHRLPEDKEEKLTTDLPIRERVKDKGDGERTYHDALLLASLSNDMESPKRKVDNLEEVSLGPGDNYPQNQRLYHTFQHVEEQITPDCYVASTTSSSADTPRRSNVNANPIRLDSLTPFVLHPKPGANATEYPNENNVNEEDNIRAVTSATKTSEIGSKITPDRRKPDDGRYSYKQASSVVTKLEGRREGPNHMTPSYPSAEIGPVWHSDPRRYPPPPPPPPPPQPYYSGYPTYPSHYGTAMPPLHGDPMSSYPRPYSGAHPGTPHPGVAAGTLSTTQTPPSHAYKHYLYPNTEQHRVRALDQDTNTGISPIPYHPLSALNKTHVVPEEDRENHHVPWYGHSHHIPYYHEAPPMDNFHPPYDARYGPHTQDTREPYYTHPTDSKVPRHFIVSMDENSPRGDYELKSTTQGPRSGPHKAAPNPEYASLDTIPRVGDGRFPARPLTAPIQGEREGDHFDRPPPPTVPPSTYLHNPAGYPNSTSNSFPPQHPPPPYPHGRVYHPLPGPHDPYEPHPHNLPFRQMECSTPPPPDEGSYGRGEWDASYDGVPATVSHEGQHASPERGKGHQFRKGQRNIHSDPVILKKKFSWRNYPELEEYLVANRAEYLRHSSLNYTAEQKHFNNRLTEGLLELAAKNNYVFDESCFNFVAVRDRIRCYYKSYVQSSKKRGVIVGFPKVNQRMDTATVEEGGSDSCYDPDVSVEER